MMKKLGEGEERERNHYPMEHSYPHTRRPLACRQGHIGSYMKDRIFKYLKLKLSTGEV